MIIDQKTTVVLDGLNLLIQRFKGNSNFTSWITPLLTIFQELENQFYLLYDIDIINSYYDIIIENEGIDNNPAWTIEEFRRIIGATWILRNSYGKYPDIESFFKKITGLVPGDRWVIRSSPADINWRSMTYNSANQLFVAVASTGLSSPNSSKRVMTSEDGINWTLRTSNTNQWMSVCNNGSIFVAVAISGTGNRAMWSSGGTAWNIVSSAADQSWYSVCWGSHVGLFVAVSITGTGYRVMTSDAGINWTLRATPKDNNWISICYGKGLFVAVSYTGNYDRVMTSTDGINWTLGKTPNNNNWYSVCYGKGMFVAVSQTGTNRIMTSYDGITWIERKCQFHLAWIKVIFAGDIFVAIAQTGIGSRCMTSPDGINWTLRQTAADNSWNAIAYGNGLLCAASASGTGNRIMTSGAIDAMNIVKLRDCIIGITFDTNYADLSLLQYVEYEKIAVLGVGIEVYYAPGKFMAFYGNTSSNAGSWGDQWISKYGLVEETETYRSADEPEPERYFSQNTTEDLLSKITLLEELLKKKDIIINEDKKTIERLRRNLLAKMERLK